MIILPQTALGTNGRFPGLDPVHGLGAERSRASRGNGDRRASRPGAGFTLVELVISTALLSMILGGAYLCMRAGVATQKVMDAREEIFQNARVAMALMTADFRCACPLSKKFEFIGMHRTLGDRQADNVDFATHHFTPTRVHESDWCEVSYFLDKDRTSGKFSLWRRRDATPDDEPFAGGSREEIARGLAGLELEDDDGFDWFDDWGDSEGQAKAQSSFKERYNLTGLPEAVRITLWFDTNAEKTSDRSGFTNNAPPLVFQTVARLNLAAASLDSFSGSSSNSPAASNPGSSTRASDAAPAGGTR